VQGNSLVANKLASVARTDDLGLNAGAGKWGWESCGRLFAEGTFDLYLLNCVSALVGLASGLATSAHGCVGTWLGSWGCGTASQ
jgi:hypothetical protein